ncbi:unnamed protein product [Pleuronectes platessa]|uniref:Uncharacterized protein n=1 Tax=Pleuronectes platessa TaxID=8262 RepID=A0A9N7TYD0_PLEPL|nr:unnamed protein product [Pleuronectes platessa]
MRVWLGAGEIGTSSVDLSGRRKEELLRLSISRDQLMAADDRAERGQGSKPCIVSPSLCTPAEFPPSLPLATPPTPPTPQSPMPRAHLHTFINSVRRGSLTEGMHLHVLPGRVSSAAAARASAANPLIRHPTTPSVPAPMILPTHKDLHRMELRSHSYNYSNNNNKTRTKDLKEEILCSSRCFFAWSLERKDDRIAASGSTGRTDHRRTELKAAYQCRSRGQMDRGITPGVFAMW